MEEHGTYEG
jgi:hypothetical protein